MATPQDPEIVREEFGATERTAIVETASTAAAAQAEAMVKARYTMALTRPRDWDTVRVKIMKECRRTGFAKTAIYEKPVGRDKVTGLSIRYVEAAIRNMTNVAIDTMILYDDSQKRIIRVSVVDMETNTPYSSDLVIPKTVERKKVQDPKSVLGSRINSYGDTVYTVLGTDDDIQNKAAALASKAIRTNGLRLIPGDIQDECMVLLQTTRQAEIEADPDAARKGVADAFATLGIMPNKIATYLGHELESATPAEIDSLRSLFAALKDGETNWAEVMDSVQGGSTDEEKSAQATKAQALQEKMRKSREAAKARAAEKAGTEAK